MTVSLLIDNDVVIKLARMGCFTEALEAIGRTAGQAASIRAMLRYMGIADSERRKRLCATTEEADRLRQALTSLVEIELTQEEAKAAAALFAVALEHGLDFDAGEAMLLVVAISRGDLDIATGDKRALGSLPALEELAPQVSVARRRFICLEQIFLQLVKAHGWRFVGEAVARSPRADEAITFVRDRYGDDDGKLLGALEFLIAQQIVVAAPGWLKSI